MVVNGFLTHQLLSRHRQQVRIPSSFVYCSDFSSFLLSFTSNVSDEIYAVHVLSSFRVEHISIFTLLSVPRFLSPFVCFVAR